jgi:hypothetical protein
VPGAVGAPPHLGQQLLPLLARGSVGVPVGARVLAAMVEELGVLALERRDLLLDEGVELGELGLDLGGDLEVHLERGILPRIRHSCARGSVLGRTRL